MNDPLRFHAEDLDATWRRFRRTCVGCCPVDRAHRVALAVRELPSGYQLRCADCGWRTVWFRVKDGHAAPASLESSIEELAAAPRSAARARR